MNKPRVVIIALLSFVVAVLISTLSVDGRASIRPVSARAHDLPDEFPTPTPPYTPEAFIPVKMFALDADGAIRDEQPQCGTPTHGRYYGCTAFCLDPDPFINTERCHHEQRLDYPYEGTPVPRVGIENDYLPDVLSQEMGPSYENSALRAGAIVMRSFGLQQFEELNFQGLVLNNSTRYQVFIPYKFNTYNPQYPGSTCGLPAPLINDEQQKLCDALAPRYYLSLDYNDYPARANHIGDILGDTETAYNAEGKIDKPYLIGVADPISFSCDAYNANENQRYGTSQSGINRWARGDQCSLAGNGSDPWSVRWTTAEQILFHYFTRVQLRDIDEKKQILSPDWRWNPLMIDWGTPDNQPPVMNAGHSYSFPIQVQNTGIYTWKCGIIGNRPEPAPYRSYQLRYRWLTSDSNTPPGLGPSMCNLEPGKAKTDILTIQVPPGWSGVYTLQLDMSETVEGFWFSDGGWPPYDVNVQIISPTPSPTPTTCGFDGC